jgi:NAD(P)-dependent dehydrogenase (short-subunit alcohol dehydrogenase family)
MKLSSDIIVFVTGGASGLGEETVRRLHAQGCKIAVADMNEERMALIKSELKERIECFNCNVSKEEDVKNAIDGTV